MKAITKQLKANIWVSNIASSNGGPVLNQLLVRTEYGVMFQSCNSNIAFIPHDEDVIYLGKDWDYSRTTSKYRNEFLGYNKKELESMIKSGKAVIIESL